MNAPRRYALAFGCAAVVACALAWGTDAQVAQHATTIEREVRTLGRAIQNAALFLAVLGLSACGVSLYMGGHGGAKWLWSIGGGIFVCAAAGHFVGYLTGTTPQGENVLAGEVSQEVHLVELNAPEPQRNARDHAPVEEPPTPEPEESTEGL